MLLKLVFFLYFALVLFFSTACGNSSVKLISDSVATNKNELKKSLQIVTAEKKEAILKRRFLNTKNIRLIKFTQSTKYPGEPGYERATEYRPLEITYIKYLNDSTLQVRAVGVVAHGLYNGIISESNDKLYLSITRNPNSILVAAISKNEFEYTIRIKKGKRYTCYI